MRKPPGITREQWDKYRKAIDLALTASSKSLDLIAEANFQAGELTERHRIIKLLEPLAKHDESCYYKRKLSCGLGDCSAWDYQYAIDLIRGKANGN